jgi:LIM domain kinase 1
VRRSANTGCPPEFTQLAIECMAGDPAARPTIRVILERLRAIEAEVLARPEERELNHTGSIKFITGGRRREPHPSIPSFGQGTEESTQVSTSPEPYLSDGGSDEELSDALSRLEGVTVVENGVPLASGTHPAIPPLANICPNGCQTTVRANRSNPFSLRKASSPTTVPPSSVDPVNNCRLSHPSRLS